MLGNMFSGISQEQLDQMLARLGQTSTNKQRGDSLPQMGEEAGEPPTVQAPAEEQSPKDNPFRLAAAQPVSQELANLPPEQLDQMIGTMKDSPMGGGDAKSIRFPPSSPQVQAQMQATQPASTAQPQSPMLPTLPNGQSDFGGGIRTPGGLRQPVQINTSAPGAIGNIATITNPNEEAAALLRQQYNTGVSDFMGAGSPYGPEHDERLKVLAAGIGQNRASQFTNLLEQQRGQQFGGAQADLNRQFQGREGDLERSMRLGLADKQGANQLAVQQLQNQGALGTEGLRGQNQIAAIVAADKAGSSGDKLATQAYMQSYSAAIASGKDPISAHAAASQVADHVRAQTATSDPSRMGGVQMAPQSLPTNQFWNPGNGQPLVPLGPDGQPLSQNAPAAANSPGLPNAQTVSRVDSIFKGIQPSFTPGEKGGGLTQDQINSATDVLMSQKMTPVEAQELARRIRAGELGDPSKVEQALAQQTAGNYFLAQPPTRDKEGAYPSKYDIPNLFTMRTNPSGGLGSRTAAGIQNIATGGIPTVNGVPVPPGLVPPGISRGNGVPYNEIMLPGGRVIPFNPTEFQSVGGELGGANAAKKNASQQRAAYQGMLLEALLKGR